MEIVIIILLIVVLFILIQMAKEPDEETLEKRRKEKRRQQLLDIGFPRNMIRDEDLWGNKWNILIVNIAGKVLVKLEINAHFAEEY